VLLSVEILYCSKLGLLFICFNLHTSLIISRNDLGLGSYRSWRFWSLNLPFMVLVSELPGLVLAPYSTLGIGLCLVLSIFGIVAADLDTITKSTHANAAYMLLYAMVIKLHNPR
jgi:hypothetical protein